MQTIDLSGQWHVRLEDGTEAVAFLPGTLDENKIGKPDQNNMPWHPDAKLDDGEFTASSRILTRLTRKYTYEGAARYHKSVTLSFHAGQRIFLQAERSRLLTLEINQTPMKPVHPGCLSAPYRFEITGLVIQGENQFALCCDNSYSGWPREDILYSSAATDETQTNWNGVIGTLALQITAQNYIEAVRIYPASADADVYVDIDCAEDYSGTLCLQSAAFAEDYQKSVKLAKGRHTVVYQAIAYREGIRRWDLEEGNLYTVSVCADAMEPAEASFGIRSFTDSEGRLALNGHRIFLRSEANCCVFPETGHMPMTADEWHKVLQTYQAYGVNCVRFHSHCPPEAAFAAADAMGILVQPELSHWNPKSALESDISYAYYEAELKQILRTYANHPSFVMLTWGNELATGEAGLQRMQQLLAIAKQLDTTRLYAISSNAFYGTHGTDAYSDFYTSTNHYAAMLRGTSMDMQGYINHKPPGTCTSFTAEMEELRKVYQKPVFSFEVGQYQVLPDFNELPEFQGVTAPDNLAAIRDRMVRSGLEADWKQRVAASGELALIAYREEVEAVCRTQAMSGISLLGLQDFPGQGTALIGMMNSHLHPKPFPFADPSRFAAFFRDVLPLICMPRYTYCLNETLEADLKLSNYSKQDINEPVVVSLLQKDTPILTQRLPQAYCPAGALTNIGQVSLPLSSADVPCKLQLLVQVGSHQNQYPLWVYPDSISQPDILYTGSTHAALQALIRGETVFLSPPADETHFPSSVQAQFTPDFWSVGTFPSQSGFMGLLLDPQHPVFSSFPTDSHTDWQWWHMCSGRAMILPEYISPLITGLDSYARMRRLGLLLEANVFSGKLILSSMGLLEKQQHPEIRALLASIGSYMQSDAFHPSVTLTLADLESLVRFTDQA